MSTYKELVHTRAERDYKDLVDVIIKDESIMSIIRSAYKIACWNEIRHALINDTDRLTEDTLFAITACPFNVINLIADYYIGRFDASEINFFGGSDIVLVIESALKQFQSKKGK